MPNLRPDRQHKGRAGVIRQRDSPILPAAKWSVVAQTASGASSISFVWLCFGEFLPTGAFDGTRSTENRLDDRKSDGSGANDLVHPVQTHTCDQ